jgi:hypothetical protein
LFINNKNGLLPSSTNLNIPVQITISIILKKKQFMEGLMKKWTAGLTVIFFLLGTAFFLPLVGAENKSPLAGTLVADKKEKKKDGEERKEGYKAKEEALEQREEQLKKKEEALKEKEEQLKKKEDELKAWEQKLKKRVQPRPATKPATPLQNPSQGPKTPGPGTLPTPQPPASPQSGTPK